MDIQLQPLAPAARVRWRVSNLLLAALLPALAVSGVLVPVVLANDGPTWLFALPAVVLIVGAGLGWWHAGRRYQRFGYGLDDLSLHVRDGVLSHSDATVPLFRVQHVDLNRGPLQLLFGLTTLTVHTAAPAADVTVPDVLDDDAQALRDRILDGARAATAAVQGVDADAV